MILNCITVDDEPLALGLINSFIEATPFLELKASFSSAEDALETIEPKEIHLAFLDIQMPNMNGIEVAKMFRNFPPDERPRVVFTTAYNQFAVESYQVEAIDYLLKPFEYEEFLRASRKASEYFEHMNIKSALPTSEQRKSPTDESLFVRVGYQLVRISWDDILYIEGLKDYAKIYLTNSETPVVALATLKSLVDKLPAERFMRVQRSFIVALNHVKALTKNSLWIGEVDITIGEQYKEPLKRIMNSWLH